MKTITTLFFLLLGLSACQSQNKSVTQTGLVHRAVEEVCLPYLNGDADDPVWFSELAGKFVQDDLALTGSEKNADEFRSADFAQEGDGFFIMSNRDLDTNCAMESHRMDPNFKSVMINSFNLDFIRRCDSSPFFQSGNHPDMIFVLEDTDKQGVAILPTDGRPAREYANYICEAF
ncbi:hypothetical protein [Aestuariispira insulae]|uniref:Lipoprotein n=1 Tax=Aestuariispira insulae TaxID=1461337 RepID=A0A3D9HRQ7_9PROT|nr:hypothetical protein [Aestuariispira insulae]RED52011.1 hypothetical protein DFP90_10227 [Aestuariispira insulae]